MGAQVTSTTSHDDENFVDVKPNLKVPRLVTASVTMDEHKGFNFDLRLRWNAGTYRYIVEHLGITSTTGISTAEIHRLSLPKLMTLVASVDVLVTVYADGKQTLGRVEEFFSIIDLDETRLQVQAEGLGAGAGSLSLVAMLYAYGRIVGHSPIDVISSVLGLPKRTATRWVAKAKTEGLLDG